MFSQETPLNFKDVLPTLVNRNQVQTLKVTGSQARPSDSAPNPIASSQSVTAPAHVQSVQVQVKKASDITSKVTVTYQRDPQDYLFVDTRVFVSGYKGNPAPTQVASGQSPVSFSLENTGEPVTVTVQSSGNLGQAPLSTAPTTTFQLTKTALATTPTPAGNGTGGSSLEVQTNGVDNSSQTLVNFKSSDGSLSVLNTSGGIVDIKQVPFPQAAPFWWASGDGSMFVLNPTGGGIFSTGTINQIKFWMFRLPVTMKVSTLRIRLNGVEAGKHFACGVYDVTGTTKYFSWDNELVTGGGNRSFSVSPAVTLAPGIYIFACGMDSASGSTNTFAGFNTSGTNETVIPWNHLQPRTGVAGNAMSSGAMPATLGTFTTATSLQTVVPYVLMES